MDIKKEHQFKPFEKVLVRDSIDDVWRASFFSHIKENDGRYVTTCVTWKFCIPYIGNESLLGTIKDVATVCGVRYKDVKSAINMTQVFAGGKKKRI